MYIYIYIYPASHRLDVVQVGVLAADNLEQVHSQVPARVVGQIAEQRHIVLQPQGLLDVRVAGLREVCVHETKEIET